MKISEVIDIEDFLVTQLSSFDYAVACPPLDPSMVHLPYIGVTRVGGFTQTEVSTIHSVAIDVWAVSDAQALAACNRVVGIIRALPYADTDPQVFESGFSAPPYLNPDTEHPSLKRASCTVNLHLKDEVVNI